WEVRGFVGSASFDTGEKANIMWVGHLSRGLQYRGEERTGEPRIPREDRDEQAEQALDASRITGVRRECRHCASLYRKCGGQDRERVVGPGFYRRGGCVLPQYGCGL